MRLEAVFLLVRFSQTPPTKAREKFKLNPDLFDCFTHVELWNIRKIRLEPMERVEALGPFDR